jgi:hypothetical protein
MAVRYGVIVFLIAHTTKTKSDTELGLGHPGLFPYRTRADLVLYTWRSKTPYRNFVKVAKKQAKGLSDRKFEVELRDGRYYEVEKNR